MHTLWREGVTTDVAPAKDTCQEYGTVVPLTARFIGCTSFRGPPLKGFRLYGDKPYHGALVLKNEVTDELARLINQHWIEHCYRYHLWRVYGPCDG